MAPNRRASYISAQLDNINQHLQGLFDAIGLTSSERDERERQLYSVISGALESYVSQVTAERDAVRQQCSRALADVRSMLAALSDVDPNTLLGPDAALVSAEIEPPYKEALSGILRARARVEEVYDERSTVANTMFSELEELVGQIGIDEYEEEDATQEPPEWKIKRTPMQISTELTRPGGSDEVDLSAAYLAKFEHEVRRWRAELQSRIASVSIASGRIVNLWAELGTPQNEIDASIMTNYKSSPEKIGTTIPDLMRLESRLAALYSEKQRRQERLEFLTKEIEKLWSKLGEDEEYTESFARQNRGLSEQTLNAHEHEYSRLLEKKRAHVGIFIQDARDQLEQLWARLYMSEAETYEFSPAWADVYTDAALEAHEAEIARLQDVLREREPIIKLIDQYKELQNEERELAAASQDASRLLQRGGGGNGSSQAPKRDPTRLLREEQMRKRIAKRKPKVVQELKVALDAWREKSGRPLTINGEDLTKTIDDEMAKLVPGSRLGLTRNRANTASSSSGTTAPRTNSGGSSSRAGAMSSSGRSSPIKSTPLTRSRQQQGTVEVGPTRPRSRAGAISPTRPYAAPRHTSSAVPKPTSRSVSPSRRAVPPRPRSVLARAQVPSMSGPPQSASTNIAAPAPVVPNLAPRSQSSLGSYRVGSPPSPIRMPKTRPVSVIVGGGSKLGNFLRNQPQHQHLNIPPERSRSELGFYNNPHQGNGNNNINGSSNSSHEQEDYKSGSRLSELSLGSPSHHSTMLMANKENQDSSPDRPQLPSRMDKLFGQRDQDEILGGDEDTTINTLHTVVYGSSRHYPDADLQQKQLQQLQQQQQDLQELHHLQQQQRALLRQYDLSPGGSGDVVMASPSPVAPRQNSSPESYSSPLSHKSGSGINPFAGPPPGSNGRLSHHGNMNHSPQNQHAQQQHSPSFHRDPSPLSLPSSDGFGDPLYQEWRERALKKLMASQAELTRNSAGNGAGSHGGLPINPGSGGGPPPLHKRSERLSEFSWEKDTF